MTIYLNAPCEDDFSISSALLQVFWDDSAFVVGPTRRVRVLVLALADDHPTDGGVGRRILTLYSEHVAGNGAFDVVPIALV